MKSVISALGQLSARATVMEASALRPIDAKNYRGRNVLKRSHHYVNSLQVAKGLGPAPADGGLLLSMDSRRSHLSDTAIGPGAAFRLLSSLAHVQSRGTDSAGRGWESRLYPAAGGCHSIEPLLYLPGADKSSEWFSIRDGQLMGVLFPDGEGLLNRMRLGHPETLGVAIVAVAQPSYVLQRYPLGMSLVWRDAGAFLATAQFAARALALDSRILGTVMRLRRNGSVPAALVVGAVSLSGQDE